MPSETTTACVRLLVFFRIRHGTFLYGVEDDASTISQTPTTHYTNTCVKLTIVTHLSFSERIAIANLSLFLFCSFLVRKSRLPGSNSRPNVSEGYEVPLSYLQLVNHWLNFTYSRSHAFRYERKNTNPTLVRIKLTTSPLLAGVQVNY